MILLIADKAFAVLNTLPVETFFVISIDMIDEPDIIAGLRKYLLSYLIFSSSSISSMNFLPVAVAGASIVAIDVFTLYIL